MPHLNELHEEFASKGLSVIGVTDESEGSTEPWIEKHGPKYPYAYMSEGDLTALGKFFGWGGYPAAALIDPEGNVVWTGHPSGVTNAMVEKHLEGANATAVGIPAVVAAWPDGTGKVAKKLKSLDYAGALKAAKKLDPQLEEIVAKDINGLIARLDVLVLAPYKRGDYLGFEIAWKRYSKAYKGLPQEEDLKGYAKKLKKDKDIKKVIKGQKMLYAIRQKMSGNLSGEEITASIRMIRKLVDEHRGTYVEVAGKAQIQQLEGMR